MAPPPPRRTVGRLLGLAAAAYVAARSPPRAAAFAPATTPGPCGASVVPGPVRPVRTTALRGIAIDVAERAPRDVASFEGWASYGGIQRSDGLRLVSEPIDETGCLDMSAATDEHVPAGSPVVCVPGEMVLSANAAMAELAGRVDGEVLDLLRANGYGDQLRQYYLMLKILSEAERGQESPWFPYLNSLPRYFSNGAAMTVFCYSVVPPLVSRLCKDERARLKNLSLGKRGISFLREDTKGSEEMWKWAYNVVYTRGFETNNGSGDFCVAPMADLFNHATDPNVALSYDGYGNCYVQATRDVPAGAPLCMSYGDPTNPSFLLSRYGFLDVTSPATFCKILPPHVSEEMVNLGYSHNRMLFFKDTGDVSEEVWDVLLYMALSSTDTAAQQQFYRAHLSGDYTTKQSIHQQYCSLTMGKLADHIDQFLEDLQDLQYRGQSAGNTWEHPRLPLIMRHNEFVKDTFLAVRAAQGLEQNSYA